MIASGNIPVDLAPVLVNSGNLKQFSSQFLSPERDAARAPHPSDHSAVRDAKQGRRVLVVDDVVDVTDMLSMLLTHAGYEVFTAASSREAIALALDHHFDLIISDIGMPEINGYELAATFKSQPGYEAVPMIAVTGYSMFDDRTRSLSAGFVAHVTKPIDPRSFLDLIEQL